MDYGYGLKGRTISCPAQRRYKFLIAPEFGVKRQKFHAVEIDDHVDFRKLPM
jgi:hypothetical protein